MLWSDSARIFTSRYGKSLYPFMVAPAGLPRPDRRTCKYTFLYASKDANITEVLNVIGFYLHYMVINSSATFFMISAFGRTFLLPDGVSAQLLHIMLYAWLGDNPESNKIAMLYQHTCRRCIQKRDAEGKWILRKNAELTVNLLMAQYSLGQEIEARINSQYLQQHIAQVGSTSWVSNSIKSPLCNIPAFNIFTDIPVCPGHSEDLGRSLRHLVFEVKYMDSRTKQVPQQPLLLNYRHLESGLQNTHHFQGFYKEQHLYWMPYNLVEVS